MNTINAIGNIQIHDTSITLEKRIFINQAKNNEFRSPIYQRNLLQRLGRKHCALCGCEIPEIIQGAHVWGVAEIARDDHFSDDIKFNHAISGENGLWLCQNHHKLFDSHYLSFNMDGHILVPSNLRTEDGQFIRAITQNESLDNQIMTENFKWYLSQRNSIRDYSHYQRLVI
ncbi:HNH endonuclease signature motif containing protein [Phocaeicola barnesiae]|uniref:HNH endonuclease signature motif containing protein n=1 Tax=Phocaeicola barnesiae TaxID=376804 RepID=UPI0025A33A2E|nr:HNH endonuclease signature motif containing protein [Phocaeicola barnesiae]MDM8251497.1 HNH endonuclease signature motif containing protein [Phocaeicola barnesiae]